MSKSMMTELRQMAVEHRQMLDENEALKLKVEKLEAALVGCNITISNLMKENDDE